MEITTVETDDVFYTIVTILFVLSLMSERIANLYKLHWPRLRTRRFSPALEKLREKELLRTSSRWNNLSSARTHFLIHFRIWNFEGQRSAPNNFLMKTSQSILLFTSLPSERREMG